MILFTNKVYGNYEKLAYDFNFTDIDGKEFNLSKFKNKVIVVTVVKINRKWQVIAEKKLKNNKIG